MILMPTTKLMACMELDTTDNMQGPHIWVVFLCVSLPYAFLLKSKKTGIPNDAERRGLAKANTCKVVISMNSTTPLHTAKTRTRAKVNPHNFLSPHDFAEIDRLRNMRVVFRDFLIG